MRNDKIGEVLKAYRKKNEFTVKDVSLRIQNKYQESVAEKTIYGWESNQAHPTSDMLLVLCELYGIHDMSSSFELNDQLNFPVKDDEKELILKYREQPDAVKEAVRRVLGLK